MANFNHIKATTKEIAEVNGNKVNTVIFCEEDRGIYLQENDTVKRYGVKIEDNLESTSEDNALSAKQGKILNDKITDTSDRIDIAQTVINNKVDKSDIINDLSSLDSTKVLSAHQGKVLNDKILAISGITSDIVTYDDVINNLTSIETQKPLSANMGRELDKKIDSTKVDVEDSIKSFGNAIYSEGYIVEGCLVNYDTKLKKLSCDAGKIVLNGLIYAVLTKEINVPNTSSAYQVGIFQKVSTSGITAEWGLKLVTEEPEDPFLPLYGISNSKIEEFNQPATPDYLINIQKYDEHANGSYVVEGLTVSALSSENGVDTYNITEGSAHIEGVEVSKSHSERLVVDQDIDLDEISYESHKYAPSTYDDTYEYDAIGDFRFQLYESPVNEITQVEKDVYVSGEAHTYITGTARYVLDHTSVTSDKVIKVWSGSTTYTKGTDYYISNNSIYWINGDSKISGGQLFYISYLYPSNVSAEELEIIRSSVVINKETSTSTITVPNVIENTEVLLFYTYKMQRIDLIVMYSDGTFGRVKGVPHRYDPQTPSVPPSSIKLARAYHDWYDLPEITNEYIKVVKMEELNRMNTHIENLYNLVARNELRFEALANAPASTYGVFVDPLTDNTMRDAGINQTAVISNDFLQLPMEFNSVTYNTGKSETLDYTSSVIIQQEDHSSAKLVNPYQAFNDDPIQVTINPSIDRWVESGDVINGGYRYKYFSNRAQAASLIGSAAANSYRLATRYNTNIVAESTTTTTTVEDYLRRLTINITASGFGSNEPVEIYFDGILVTSGSADVSGNVDTTFVIPDGIPNGTKLVRIIGTDTRKEGFAYYVGIHEKKNTVNYYYQIQIDPIAQTFKLSENRLITGVQFWLSTSGTSDMRIEIRDVSNGYPSTNTLASCIIPQSELQTANKWVSADFDVPVFLSADVEYCITILCTTSDYAVGTAKLGDYVEGKGWITSQPYDIGVLFSSSNASAWTAHQTEDLSFKLMCANFNNNNYTKTINLKSEEDLTGVTDILPLMEVETTGANTDAQIVITDNNGVVVAKTQAWQSTSFDTALDGKYKIDLVLKGDAKYSPIVSRDPQLITAKIQSSGTYVSRGFTCGTNKKVMITLIEYKPDGAGITVSVQTGGAGVYNTATLDNETALGNGWYSRQYSCECSIANTRVKIDLAGSASARPFVVSISAVILDA